MWSIKLKHRNQNVLLVTRRRPLHAQKAKVSVLPAEAGAFPVLELAAGAQPLHQQPVQEEGQAEGKASVSSGKELEAFWRKDEDVSTGTNTQTVPDAGRRPPPSRSVPLNTHRFSPPQCC